MHCDFFHHGVIRIPHRRLIQTDVGLVDFVNSHYEQVSLIIRTFKGFIVKSMGGGIMAVFPNRADDALQAAITKQRCVAEYNEHRLKKGDPPIGLHTGHMMVIQLYEVFDGGCLAFPGASGTMFERRGSGNVDRRHCNDNEMTEDF